jgi:hypothetical protein
MALQLAQERGITLRGSAEIAADSSHLASTAFCISEEYILLKPLLEQKYGLTCSSLLILSS